MIVVGSLAGRYLNFTSRIKDDAARSTAVDEEEMQLPSIAVVSESGNQWANGELLLFVLGRRISMVVADLKRRKMGSSQDGFRLGRKTESRRLLPWSELPAGICHGRCRVGHGEGELDQGSSWLRALKRTMEHQK
ncbi:hypothetical protein ACLOJK_012049 [Asimina triloba]